jgi:hypothetical protein
MNKFSKIFLTKSTEEEKSKRGTFDLRSRLRFKRGTFDLRSRLRFTKRKYCTVTALFADGYD